MATVAEIMTALKQRREAGVPGNRESIWARPVSWRGLGMALDYNTENERLDVVPFFAHPHSYAPTLDELIEEWELVDPFNVLEERS